MLDKHAAVGPVAIAAGGASSPFGTAAYVSEWQTGKVVRVALTPTSVAGGYRGLASTFLTGVRNPNRACP